MYISLIAALSRNHVIGQNNQLPWHLPADLKHFKSITLGKPIVMGRKTYASIGKPLPGRTNIILTHELSFQAEGCSVVHSLDQALAAAGAAEEVLTRRIANSSPARGEAKWLPGWRNRLNTYRAQALLSAY